MEFFSPEQMEQNFLLKSLLLIDNVTLHYKNNILAAVIMETGLASTQILLKSSVPAWSAFGRAIWNRAVTLLGDTLQS